MISVYHHGRAKRRVRMNPGAAFKKNRLSNALKIVVFLFLILAIVPKERVLAYMRDEASLSPAVQMEEKKERLTSTAVPVQALQVDSTQRSSVFLPCMAGIHGVGYWILLSLFVGMNITLLYWDSRRQIRGKNSAQEESDPNFGFHFRNKEA